MATSSEPFPKFSLPDANDRFLQIDKKCYTYQELFDFTLQFDQWLQERSVDTDQPIAIIHPVSVEYVMILSACWFLGIPVAPVFDTPTTSKLIHQLDRLQPSMVLCNTDDYALDEFPTFDLGSIFDSIINGNYQSVFHLNFPQPDPDQIFGYFFTSGSTGDPKIVPLKRRQMLFASQASAQNFRPDRNSFWLHCLPLHHIGGFSIVIRSLLYGSGIYLIPRFTKKTVQQLLASETDIQAVSLVPTMLRRLMAENDFAIHSNVKAILCGGGPLSPFLIDEARERGIPVVSSYGMTETCAQIAANPINASLRQYIPQKSVGTIFQPNEIQIRNEDLDEVSTNITGTIWLRGPQVFDRYTDETNTTQRFDNDGWFNTGDFGHLNTHDHLFIEMRRSDLIITGGENVNPHEVESALNRMDPVKESVVIGLPDTEWGQRVTAIIVPENAANPPALNDIKEHLPGVLAKFKWPKSVHITDELPKTASGKIHRNVLMKQYNRTS